MNSSRPPFAQPASFAHLTPLNAESRKAFNDVALQVSKEVDYGSTTALTIRHSAKFMVIEPWTTPGPSDPPQEKSQSPPPSLSDTGSTGRESSVDLNISSPIPAPEELQYQGYYDLSFENPPDIPRIGWVAGIGRWTPNGRNFTKTGVIDLMLAPSDSKKLYSVRGKHATLFFDDSGSLCISSPPEAPSFLGAEEFSGQRVISSRSQLVSFGSLTYCLEFKIADESTYQSNLNKYFASYLSRPVPPPDISTTPSPWDLEIHDWVCKGTAGSGAFGTVSAAKHRITSETAAAKFVVRTSKTMRDIAHESSVLGLLPDHPRLLSKRGIYYERGDSWFSSPEDENDERYGLPARPERVVFIIQPFARLTLAELLPRLSPTLTLIVFHQILEGVDAMHHARPCPLVHRDLKLANIGVVSYNDQNITIVILDYGQTIQVQQHDPVRGKAGTPGYQAPEMQNQVHDTSLDIWSCGIIGLKMFVPEWPHSPNVRVDFEVGVATLGVDGQGTARSLVAQMLAWDHTKRISIADALFHSCFSCINKDSNPISLKRHRKKD
jgi:hypothetical protein